MDKTNKSPFDIIDKAQADYEFKRIAIKGILAYHRNRHGELYLSEELLEASSEIRGIIELHQSLEDSKMRARSSSYNIIPEVFRDN